MTKKAIVLILFVVFASPDLMAQKWSVWPDGYFQVSTCIRLGSKEPMDYYYDWSVGFDAGVGVEFGPFHAGIAGGMRSQALIVLIVLLCFLVDAESDRPDFDWYQVYLDFPVRCYFGMTIDRSFYIRVDAFWGRYYRTGNHSEAPPEQNFEAGIKFARDHLFLEVSYIWPQKKLVRIHFGLHWGV
jgi:hypothetical protein